MIAKLMHHVREWIEERKREREVDEEFKGDLSMPENYLRKGFESRR